MNTPNFLEKTCARCGAPVPPDAPEGLCPRCLGALPLDTETVPADAGAPASPPLTPEELAPHFPNLEILECLGRGGMGVVYKARQKSLGRLVALKLLAPERTHDAAFEQKFAQEARALAALNHPNIVTIHDFGRAGGFFYLIMEYVDGVNLRAALRGDRFTPEQALAIVPPVCEALQYAHDHGVVHRDIKPENLLLDREGRVKVADFGIAKMLRAETGAGEVGVAETAAGTPRYMAPEQRERGATDHRADIYSLGVVLYELLTGELPGDRLEPPSRKVRIDVRLDEIVLRALERTPELRYENATVMKTQLERVAQSGQDGAGRENDIAASKKTPSGELILGPRSFPFLHVVYRGGNTARGVVAVGYRAKGFFALGMRSTGVVAVGGVAIGGIAIGGVSLGILSLGGIALGALYAFGFLAFGSFAVGMLGAVGWWAISQGAAVGVVSSGVAPVINSLFFQTHEDPTLGYLLFYSMLIRPGWVACAGTAMLVLELLWRLVGTARRRCFTDNLGRWSKWGYRFGFGLVFVVICLIAGISLEYGLRKAPFPGCAGVASVGEFPPSFFERTGIDSANIIGERVAPARWYSLTRTEEKALFDAELPGLFFLNPDFPQSWFYWVNNMKFRAGSPAELVLSSRADAGLNWEIATRTAKKLNEHLLKVAAKLEEIGNKPMPEWLGRIDSGAYAESWEESGDFLKIECRKSDWIRRLEDFRRPMGRIVSRVSIVGPKYVKNSGSVIHWNKLMAQYKTDFEGRRGVIETVIFVWQTKVGWRPAGYSIAPGTVNPDSPEQPQSRGLSLP